MMFEVCKHWKELEGKDDNTTECCDKYLFLRKCLCTGDISKCDFDSFEGSMEKIDEHIKEIQKQTDIINQIDGR